MAQNGHTEASHVMPIGVLPSQLGALWEELCSACREIERLRRERDELLAQERAADPEVKALPQHGEIGNGRRDDVINSTCGPTTHRLLFSDNASFTTRRH
jgi:hypothetical protein